MKPSVTTTALRGLALAGAAGAAYVWPSKYDEMEDVFSLATGLYRRPLAQEVTPCSFGTNVAGRQNAAEWVRVAYHDMATADVEAGTGGLDASIQYETDRDENEGTAFFNTLTFFTDFYNVRASAADIIALGAVASVARCGGPKVPFRAGRIDASGAGPWGVPKPDQDLKRHTDIFAKQGFNTEEMITMVACGHTLGGVHNEDFPNIVMDPNPQPENVTLFEGKPNSRFGFDNAVVTEYLDGTSPNPLVSGHNDTTNSDKRVFGADGNKTMQALADPAAFRTKCQDIFARMLDTVPRGVVLSEPLEGVNMKPYIDRLGVTADGKLSFAGRIRVRIDNTGRDGYDLAVSLSYSDRTGAVNAEPITTSPIRQLGGQSRGMFGEVFQWFDFSTTLSAEAGISKFDIRLTTVSSGKVEVFTNEARGYPVQDTLLYQLDQSCLDTTDRNSSTFALSVVAAVRQDRASEPLVMHLVHKVKQSNSVFDRLEVRPAALTRTGTSLAGYDIFRVDVPLEQSSWSTSFDLTLGSGESATQVDFKRTNQLGSVCRVLREL